MPTTKNVLFIMCDQLRFDYLSCAGHPTLKTPNIDALAARGVRFTNAYVQSPVCGSSRMCYYTGRYMRSHGSHWNGWPLRVGEITLGEHLRPLGVRTALVGKTHMTTDKDGMERLGIEPGTTIGALVAECGFEAYERDDGLHPPGRFNPNLRYNAWLREHGYDAKNPWEEFANGGQAEDGTLQNGWLMVHSDKAARVAEEHSETPYMTMRAMEFIDDAEREGQNWCLHLSYIKPHWPYIAPEPYASMYKPKDVIPVVRSNAEREHPHPVYGAFMGHRYSQNFSRDGAREKVIPAYMGLIKQIDDQLGKLFKFLDDAGVADKTLIVFTADHGDYLGDHWMGEKDLFHEPSVKVPMIVYDPTAPASARGRTDDRLIEAIDLVPTFIDYFGGKVPHHIVEGRSLMPVLRGEKIGGWRKYVFSEYDYSMQDARATLNQPVDQCRLFMVFDGRWKYVHATGYRPMLFDLASDAQEFVDLGDDPEFAAERARMEKALFDWALTDHSRITTSYEKVRGYNPEMQLKTGILIGYWDENEVETARKSLGK